jgi:hypothetical protein
MIGTLLPQLSDPWIATVSRGAVRERWRRSDWERHFKHRMSYDEYHYIGLLQTAVFRREIGPEYAVDALAEYRKRHPYEPPANC